MPNLRFTLQDITKPEASRLGKFDTVFSVDVLEHLDSDKEKPFIEKSIELLDNKGIYMRNAKLYSSGTSGNEIRHINLKTAPQKSFLKSILIMWIFSMNDEVVHTGFYPMAHYLFAVCAGKKE